MLLLGRGKTGGLVAEVARERGHQVHAVGRAETAGLSAEDLRRFDVAVDFTTPDAVLDNIQRCAEAGLNLAVGTTGWYEKLPQVRQMVESSGIGLVYAANFSIGVNIFFEAARAAAAALPHGYTGRIREIHHIHKKDAPSGTAVVLRNVVAEAGGADLPIESVREGEVIGTHELTLESAADVIFLKHQAHSRRGFAEGAVLAAEWLHGKKGFFEFAEVLRSAG